MTDLHPDDLVHRAAKAPLQGRERERLETHLDSCSACRLELMVRRSAEAELVARPDDDALLAAAATRALTKFRAAGRATSPIASPPGRAPLSRRSVAALAALAAVLVVAIAAAVFSRSTRFDAALPDGAEGSLAPASVDGDDRKGDARWIGEGSRAVERDEAERDEVVSPPESLPATDEAAPEVAPTTESAVPARGRASHRERKAARAIAPQPEPAHTVNADELFTRAIEASKRGEDKRALETFADLRQRFPHSREARTSWVSSGRLHLKEESGAARALRCFDAYLASGTDGLLAPEALAGKATALERLGRDREARATWQRLLEKFPHSALAAKAGARGQE